MPYGKDSAITGGGYGKDAPVAPEQKSNVPQPLYTGLSGETWPVDLSPSDIGEMAKGIIPGALGVYGDLSSLARTGIEKLGVPKIAAEFLTPAATVLPTTSQVENIFGKPASDRSAAYRQLGEFAGGMISPEAAISAGKPLVRGATEAADVLSKAAPLSGRKAVELVKTIGPATDESVLGEKMSNALRDRMEKLWQDRSDVTSGLRNEAFSQNDKSEFVRRKMLGWLRYIKTAEAPNLGDAEKSLISDVEKTLSSRKSIEGLDKARRDLDEISHNIGEGGAVESRNHLAERLSGILRDVLEKSVPGYKDYLSSYAQMSEPVNLFTDTALGKRVSQDVSKRLEIPKSDPASLPGKFFKTKDSVRKLLQISGGDKKFVSDSASEYAASQLNKLTRDKRIGEAATAARNWFNNNKIWLDQVPDVEANIEKRVLDLEKTATVHRVRNYAGLGLMGALGVGGVEYALRRGLGF